MYCLTNGYSNSLLSFCANFFNPFSLLKNHPLANLRRDSALIWEDDLQQVIADLRKNGYVVLKTKLPKQICDDLVKFAETTPCLPSGDNQSSSNSYVKYESKIPKAPSYKFKEPDLAENQLIQKLASDPYFIKIAGTYLKAAPVLDLIAMWWSTAFKKEADDNTAQMYHFDMDRLKWLKIFFYLTDVDSETGAHCYIARSHRPGQKPYEIRRRGYTRIPDKDLIKYYPRENFREISGKAGTIIIGDTMAYHKGKPLSRGHRLILEFEYANCLFGAPVEKIKIKNASPEFIKLKQVFPKFFQKFVF